MNDKLGEWIYLRLPPPLPHNDISALGANHLDPMYLFFSDWHDGLAITTRCIASAWRATRALIKKQNKVILKDESSILTFDGEIATGVLVCGSTTDASDALLLGVTWMCRFLLASPVAGKATVIRSWGERRCAKDSLSPMATYFVLLNILFREHIILRPLIPVLAFILIQWHT